MLEEIAGILLSTHSSTTPPVARKLSKLTIDSVAKLIMANHSNFPDPGKLIPHKRIPAKFFFFHEYCFAYTLPT